MPRVNIRSNPLSFEATVPLKQIGKYTNHEFKSRMVRY